MNSPDCNPDVCTKDSYGNVTAKNQGGNDVRNEMKYSGYTIDVGIQCLVWKPDNSFFDKFPNLEQAKAAIDSAIESK